MKKLLCKFANWVLRKYMNPITRMNGKIYINGREYTVRSVSSEFSRHPYTVINFEVIDGDSKW